MRTGRTIREDDARFRGQEWRVIPVAYTASAVLSDGEPSGAVITFRDITERKAFEDELHQHAFYDSLTGLANRGCWWSAWTRRCSVRCWTGRPTP